MSSIPDMFVNELSFDPPVENKYAVYTLLHQFTDTVRYAIYKKCVRALFGCEKVFSMPLSSDSYYIHNWLNDNSVDREERQFLRSQLSSRPYINAKSAINDIDCLLENKTCYGIKDAFINNGIAVSLLSAKVWNTKYIDVEIQELIDDINITKEVVAHASNKEHIDFHLSKLNENQLYINNGNDLHNQLSSLFPKLIFSETAKNHIINIPKHLIRRIVDCLALLNTYREQNATGVFISEKLGCDSSPESPGTLSQFARERTCMCPDGVSRTFSWHIKTCGWRIYFAPDAMPETILIGYIGKHLKTKKNG